MQCASCGAATPEDARFCPECGAAVAQACPGCGRRNPPGALYCAGCGRAQAAAAPGPAPRALAPDEHRQVTVLFCDLVGSTELSVRTEPEEFGAIMRAYQECCTEVIGRFDGHVAKLLGDGVLAFFGYPQAHEDDPERAVRAALTLVDAVGELRPGEAVRLRARVGISTGRVMVTDVGGVSQEVLGEAPNRAARLQELAAPGGVVVGPQTRGRLGELFEYADLGAHPIKGFDQPVQVWQVVGARPAATRFEALRGAAPAPLVGRDHELGLLLARWQQAREGEGQVVLLSGEPGIGKSRLVRALREAVADRVHREMRYQCLPYHQHSALQPAIEELEEAAGIGRDDDAGARLAKLRAHLDRLGPLPPDTPELLADLLRIPGGGRAQPAALAPQQRQARTLDALQARLRALAARFPLILIVEDAHWIDPTSRQLLERIIGNSRELPILVVVTLRPEAAPLRMGQASATALALGRLSDRLVATMIARIAGERGMPAEVTAEIVRKADGIPLFVEELARTVLDAGGEPAPGGAGRPLHLVAVPASLRDSLTARLDRLGPLKEVAQTGAVIGREFDYELIAAASGMPRVELDQALERLVEAELLLRRGEPPDAVYSFKHALLQEAAYAALVRERRQNLHERIARVLASDFPDVLATRPELIAQHCAAAGLDEEAVEFWREAGGIALARGAAHEAAAHLENALAILARFPASRSRDRTELDLQTALGNALIAARGFAASETGEAFARAWALAQPLGDDLRLLPILYGRWIFHIARAEIGDALDAADLMVRLAQTAGDEAATLVAHRAMANTWFFLGDLARAEGHAERVIEGYDRARHAALANQYAADPAVVSGMFLAHTLLCRGLPEQARVHALRAQALAGELGHVVTQAHALHHACLFHQLRRDAAEVERHAGELVELADHYNMPFWRALGRIFRGWAWAMAGRAETGLKELRDALAAYRATSGRLYLPYALALLAEVARAAGDPEAGLAALAEAHAVVHETGIRGFEADLHRLEGELRLALAQVDASEAAQAAFGRALEVARDQGAALAELRAALGQARLWQLAGRRAEARGLLAPVLERFAESRDLPELSEARALLDEAG